MPVKESPLAQDFVYLLEHEPPAKTLSALAFQNAPVLLQSKSNVWGLTRPPSGVGAPPRAHSKNCWLKANDTACKPPSLRFPYSWKCSVVQRAPRASYSALSSSSTGDCGLQTGGGAGARRAGGDGGVDCERMGNAEPSKPPRASRLLSPLLTRVVQGLLPPITVVPRKSGHPLSPNTQIQFAVVSGYQG